MSQTEDYSPGDSLSDNSEELLQRSMVFSTVLYLFRTKNIKQVSDRFLQGFKKKKEKQQISMYIASQHGLGPWEGTLIIEGVPALASREAFNLCFIYFFILYFFFHFY